MIATRGRRNRAVLAELLTLILSATLVIRNRRRYGYGGQPATVVNIT